MNCRFDRPRSRDGSDLIWTPRLVEERLAEAAAVLQRLPAPRRQGYFNTWPRHSYEFGDLVGQAPRQTSLPPPSPAVISRMEETLTWTIGLDPIDGGIVWLRAHNAPWKAICWKVGLQRSAANERWLFGLCIIAMNLNRQPMPRKRSRRYVIERMKDFSATALL
ncbi:DUF6362 family protein [Aerobium aerolatum]|uniref:DUF6362 domain-containing protein n=1 Tax=Aquamicrobium aerolatum DSM 21857 TaxID=1121003 RepID=A0A1I3P832_9HYPH|nr:DUF6362 family protein [Aquamicrobium aerolatum]SFJ17561.1 hypothetical protein SAMN03080618_02235 [Aquamicrobium aerolatum DSM 21857]